VAISPDGQALFAINTGSGSISRYAVAANGTLTLAGTTPMTGTGLGAFDAAVSPDGGFLYVVDARVARIGVFAVDGTSITELAGSPVAIPGGVAPFGMVVD
jgi:6-phosphogluconolactonase